MSRCVTLGHDLEAAGRAALRAEHGARRVEAALRARPQPGARRVLAVGKAAWAMAEGALRALGSKVDVALVVCKDRPPVRFPANVTVLVAGHPRPDARSVIATEAALSFCAEVPSDEDLLVLLSGGTSALLGGPIAGTSLEALAARTEVLLRSGADITAINAERRQLGAALGGRLAQAARARAIRALVLSDVLTDDLRTIGSGPLHGAVIDPRVDAAILASPMTLRAAAAHELRAAGYVVRERDALVQGDVHLFVDELAGRARTLAPGECFVAAGEPTLVVAGDGVGGRVTHTALLLAEVLAGEAELAALALASDGSDGPTELAGALVSGETAARATAAGLSLASARARFDSGCVLDTLGCALRTGPTGTNLTDLYVIGRAR